MSNITSYSRGGQYVYQEWKHFENASGASGTSGASGVGTSSNASGASGASGASAISSGASGAVYEYGGVQNLDAEQIIELFREGRLVKAEMEKWLSANRTLITDLSFTETKDLITYKFSHKGKEYTVSCTPEASKSQTDNKTQRIYSKGQIESYKSRYKLTNEDVAKYFVLASFNGTEEFYAINTQSGIKDINEFKKIKEEELKAAKEAEAKEAAAKAEAERAKENTQKTEAEKADVEEVENAKLASKSSSVTNNINDNILHVLRQQGLRLYTYDEEENSKNRIVAIDDRYYIYDFDVNLNRFVRRIPKNMVNSILNDEYNYAGEPFNISDVVKEVNYELELSKDPESVEKRFLTRRAEELNLTYIGDKKATNENGEVLTYNEFFDDFLRDDEYDPHLQEVADKRNEKFGQGLRYMGRNIAIDKWGDIWIYEAKYDDFSIENLPSVPDGSPF